MLGEESAQAIPEYTYIGTDLQLVGMLVHRLLGELSTILKRSYLSVNPVKLRLSSLWLALISQMDPPLLMI